MINQESLKAFNTIYYKTYSYILKYVVLNCSNIEDAKDIVQNIYLSVLKKLEKEDILVNEAYVMGIAKNKVKDYYRFNYKAKIISLFTKFNKEEELELIDVYALDFDMESSLVKTEDLKFIWNYLKKKNSIIAKIFYLYYYLNLSIKDISKELNIKEANVKNYLYRTLKELKILMEGEE